MSLTLSEVRTIFWQCEGQRLETLSGMPGFESEAVKEFKELVSSLLTRGLISPELAETATLREKGE